MKKFSIWLLTISLFFVGQNVKAESGYESFEKFLWEIGYQEISVALQESEQHFNLIQQKSTTSISGWMNAGMHFKSKEVQTPC